MNNSQALVEKDKGFIQQPTGISQLTLPISEEAKSAQQANNMLNTFQEIEPAEKPEKNSLDNNGLADAISQVTKGNSSSQVSDKEQTTLSDERCKELFGSRDILDAIADIDAYRFRYKEGADKIDPNATSDKVHTGVMAQELKASPVTEAAVEKDPLSGFLTVNTKELTMTTFALVTEMAKRIKAIEEKLGDK